MRLNATKVREQMLTYMDQRKWSIAELSKRCKIVTRTTLHRIANNVTRYTDRATARDIASAMDLEIVVKGDQVYFREKTKERGDEEQKKFVDVWERHNEFKKLEGIIRMLQDVDAESIRIAEQLIGIILEMEKHEIIELLSLVKTLKLSENKNQFVKRLKALATLIMPDNSEIGDFSNEKGEKRFPGER